MNQKIIIIYDKDCYLCSNFQAYLELKKNYQIKFVDLNTNPDIVKGYADKGYEIQNGMVLDLNDKIFQGEQAVMEIQKLLKPSSLFDKFMSFCMRTPRIVAIGYPIAHFVRKILLWRTRMKKLK